MNALAEKFRAEAAAHEAEAAASFERCDTDGFLSQWASGINAQLARRKAEIAENGGKAKLWGLYEGERRVAARLITGQFGTSWLLMEEEAARFGRKFLPHGENSRIQKKLGLAERLELAPAAAKLESNGTGLSGQVWVEVFRTGDKWGLDAELVK